MVAAHAVTAHKRLHVGGLGAAHLVGKGAAGRKGAAHNLVCQVRRRTVDGFQTGARVVLGGQRVNEAHGVGVLGVVQQVARVGDLNDAAGVHDAHVVAHLVHDAQVVRHEQDGHAELLAQVVEQADDLVLDGDVQSGGGLVGKQQARLACQGDGDHHALTHAARHLMDVVAHAVGRLGDAHEAQQLDGALLHLLLAQTLALEGLEELLAHGGNRVERGHRVLEDHADLFAAQASNLTVVHRRELLALVAHGAAHDLAHLGQQAHERTGGGGLTAARLAYQAERLALGDGERDLLHGTHCGALGYVVH